ncbi:aquaporin [Candidatus Marinamargulisbacteria bacterium SCGC AAA071-K20]|nr:aquaporin [Candidatus Marinamargulisbacteria bacterium SCGC AAA071-K20]
MKKYFCELIGTFFLVFAGTGAIIANDIYGGSIGHVGIALSFGLVVMAVIYAVGDTSGAHINPAVTLGFFAIKRINLKEAIFYISFQCIGALLASLFLHTVFPGHQTLGATVPSVPVLGAFIYEYLLTFFLMLVILSVATGAKEKGLMAGVAIGGTVALEALFAGPVTGASMNPARSLGPALISGELHYLWIYLCATVLGAISAVPACKWLHIKCCETIA